MWRRRRCLSCAKATCERSDGLHQKNVAYPRDDQWYGDGTDVTEDTGQWYEDDADRHYQDELAATWADGSYPYEEQPSAPPPASPRFYHHAPGAQSCEGGAGAPRRGPRTSPSHGAKTPMAQQLELPIMLKMQAKQHVVTLLPSQGLGVTNQRRR